MITRPLGPLLAVGALASTAACGPSDAYDGLTGGTKSDPSPAALERDDPTIGAPRPLSPISVSFVATFRPRLRWAPGERATGAVVELCRTRACEAGPDKRFEADGTELVVPEDLPAGVWFWRLRGRESGRVGAAVSPSWELVVRGPAKHGASDVPTGAMLDVNGDGEPDLLTVGDDGWATLFTYLGGPSGFSEQRMGAIGSPAAAEGAALPAHVTVAGGVDVNGDGIADFFETTGAFEDGRGGKTVAPWGSFGAPTVLEDPSEGFPIAGMSPLEGTLRVREMGDFDGDGYGDLVVTDEQGSFVQLGRPSGVGPIVPFGPGRTPALLGALDPNGDGLSDVVWALPEPGRAAVTKGSRDGTPFGGADLVLDPASASATPVAFASGDFDGDGVSDVATVAAAGDLRRICVWRGNRELLFEDPRCAPAPSGVAAFGASLAAGDLEGDGADEIVASGTVGGVTSLYVVRLGEAGVELGPAFAPGLGAALSTVWPGRPGKARIAATADDGSRIVILEGVEPGQSIPRPSRVARDFGRVLR